MGNPVLEFATDFNSRAEFFWSHGLISDSTYRIFTSACNYSRYVSEYYRGSLSPVCARVMSQVTRETSRFVDKYDVTLDVCISSVLSQSLVLSPQVGLYLFAGPWPTFTLIPVSELDFVCAAASPGEYWCVYRGWNSELSQPERCAGCSPCPPDWSDKMDSLQQVSMVTWPIEQHNMKFRDFTWIVMWSITWVVSSYSSSVVLSTLACLLECITWCFNAVSFNMSCLTWKYPQ